VIGFVLIISFLPPFKIDHEPNIEGSQAKEINDISRAGEKRKKRALVYVIMNNLFNLICVNNNGKS
jgi:hypothetical protein